MGSATPVASAAPGAQFVDTRPGGGGSPAGARPSVQEAVTRGRGDLVGGERSAQRPVAGLSVSGRRSAAGMMDAHEQTQAEQNAARADAASGGASTKPPEDSKPEDPPAKVDDDDASIRFSLLELD